MINQARIRSAGYRYCAAPGFFFPPGSIFGIPAGIQRCRTAVSVTPKNSATSAGESRTNRFRLVAVSGIADLHYADFRQSWAVMGIVKHDSRDVSSPYCQAHKRITVERLDKFDDRKGEWKEVLLEDRHAGPSETAAARIDIATWFDRLPRR
ncbi:MAG: hypothetical protein NTY19_08980, partial [Planctomycetota bacterium]|nr:hypothetical protein [Planctomycetota bacterium]